jgi:hypothetical protein
MPSPHELNRKGKINLIKDKERGLSHLELKDKCQLSLDAVSEC